MARPAPRPGLSPLASLALLAGATLGTVGTWWAMHVAPVEAELKLSQKIFYWHMPLGVCAILLGVAAAIAAALHLQGRSARSAAACDACMEVQVLTCAVVLATGSLWAKPAWGEWFPWGEPRVTTMLVLFLLGVAYLVVRSSVDEPGRRARFGSVVALVGGFDAVLSYFAIHLWNTTHPRIITPQGVGLEHDMRIALVLCLGAALLLVGSVTVLRYRLGRLEARVDHAAAALEELEGSPP